MKSVLLSVVLAVVSVGGASCAQPQKPVVATRAVPTGLRFDEIGKVTMHAGQPCTSQIMFDFRPDHSKSWTWLSARVQETKLLTEAAQRRRRVHVSGNWQHGRGKGCSYVHVTRVEPVVSRFLFF
jgi:hypothetical protein